jgi:hypothetical protein
MPPQPQERRKKSNSFAVLGSSHCMENGARSRLSGLSMCEGPTHKEKRVLDLSPGGRRYQCAGKRGFH